MEGWSLKTHLLSHVVEPLGSEKFPLTGPPASGPWFSCRDPGKVLVERTLQVSLKLLAPFSRTEFKHGQMRTELLQRGYWEVKVV